MGLCILTLAACAVNTDSRAYRIADVNLKLGIGYLEQNNLRDARRVLEKALESYYNHGEVHSVLAVVYEKLYMFDEAGSLYESAISLQSDNGAVYNNYGGFLCRQKKFKDADYYFRKAMKFRAYEALGQVYENAGICQSRINNSEQAEQYFREALKIHPKLAHSLLGMAKIMFGKKHYLSTRAYLQRYEEVSKHNSQSLFLGIQVERHLGDPVAENRYAKLLRSEFPDSQEYKQWLNASSQGDITP